MSSRSPAAEPLADSVWKTRLRQRLLRWFQQHARDLPWRRTRDPYQVWVSEIMLQQTQAATVADYFPRFIAAFPTVASLARADQQQVLRLWEGLGYYRRARQLHQAARVIVREHGGRIPRQAAALQALPGVGRYTAGAVLSIAFDARQPIVEANTTRVLSRLLAFDGDPSRGAGLKRLWDFAAEILPQRRAGDFNQALMELGSEICRLRDPHCQICPAAALCPTRQQGLQQVIPPARKKTAYQDLSEAAVIIRRGTSVLLRQCGPGERWAGLWDFPRFALDHGAEASRRRQLSLKVRELTGIRVGPLRPLTRIRHAVTRFRITLDCYEAPPPAGRAGRARPPLKWISVDQLPSYPLSVTGRKIAKMLAGDLS